MAISQLLADRQTPSDLREGLAQGNLGITYDFRYDVLNATHLALIAPVLFFDLTMILLINATPVPFVFSDDPARCANLLLWVARDLQGITGYGSRGLIAFMPLCERLTVMFFDGGAYTLRSPATNRCPSGPTGFRHWRDPTKEAEKPVKKGVFGLFVHRKTAYAGRIIVESDALYGTDGSYFHGFS